MTKPSTPVQLEVETYASMKLVIHDLAKTWRHSGVRAVDGVDLDLDVGIHGLLGPNGAGKTTLIRLLTGELRPDRGTLTYSDRRADEDWTWWRGLFGYVPQQQQVYPDMNCRQFLMYMAALKGLNGRPAMAEIERAIAATALEAFAGRRVGQLSGGMRQRLLIAQAILGDPAILILDEPTAGLDPQERIRIRHLISRLGLDRIVLLATHIVTDIESIASRVIFLRQGRVCLSGSPSELLAQETHTVIEVTVARERLDELLAEHACSRVQEAAAGGLRLRLVGSWPEWPDWADADWIRDAERRPATLEDLYIRLFAASDPANGLPTAGT